MTNGFIDLRTHDDLFKKLGWEFNSLSENPTSSYLAFNFFVTTWHLSQTHADSGRRHHRPRNGHGVQHAGREHWYGCGGGAWQLYGCAAEQKVKRLTVEAQSPGRETVRGFSLSSTPEGGQFQELNFPARVVMCFVVTREFVLYNLEHEHASIQTIRLPSHELGRRPNKGSAPASHWWDRFSKCLGSIRLWLLA